jgi:hypothetical protein
VCACTELQGCQVGCDWVDETRTRCTACDLGARVARIMLAIVAELPKERLPTNPELASLDVFGFKHQQLLIMSARLMLEELPSPASQDLEILRGEVGALMEDLSRRFPKVVQRAQQRGTSLRELVLELLGDRRRDLVLIGG